MARVAPPRIRTRLSSVTNSFVQAILLGFRPTQEEIEEALRQLGQTYDDRRCVYCGDRSTDFDHLIPLVRGRRPSGFLTEARNLVPACGTCNQSKGGSDWRKWMLGTAKNSPAARGIPDIPQRIETLERFIQWGKCAERNVAGHVQPKLWEDYWAKLDQIEALMDAAQSQAAIIKQQIEAGLSTNRTV